MSGSGSSGSGFSGSSSGFGSTSSGSSGSGFTGSSSSFTGSSGSTSYSTTNRSSSKSSTGKVVPQPSDPFQSYYVNPYSYGVTTGTSTTATASFGTPLYGTVNTPTTTTSSVSGAGTGAGGFTTVGMRRAPSFTTTLGFAPPAAPVAGQLQTVVRGLLERSSGLASGDIEVLVVGSGVILRGRVASDSERRLAEGLVWLTPGVREVRNELTVPGLRPKATP